MSILSEHKSPRPRFARSINVERDSGTSAIDGYLPVGRAIDAISRLANALDRSDVEVAISITGPYGSGKSSLAIILDALLGPANDPSRHSAEELLAHTAPQTLDKLISARQRLGADTHGFIRATVTAQRESIITTILRALLHGVERFEAPRGTKTALAELTRTLEQMSKAAAADVKSRPDTRAIRRVITELGAIAPVFLLIDEFGKNLEAFADSQSDADLFLLQELAEWTRGGDGIPLALVTLQHMAFDEYADTASASQRREWAKIQGRFEDIPFVDSPAQTRSLIAAAFDPASPKLAAALEEWSLQQAECLSQIGLTDLANDPTLLASCWPLHPIALAALPELCERYGQNERTLFSFLAGHEPRSVASFLDSTDWSPGLPLPVVHLDRLYDYFLEAAANLVSVSANASRWLEIDNRVRDAIGLDDAARRVLKTVGLLNLVSAGGTLRASRSIICHAAANGDSGTKNPEDVAARLNELEVAGLITFRDFADEYRVWQGSDFDLRSAVDLARRRLRDFPAADILNQVLPLGPIVAARHSHQSGTLRFFERSWLSADAKSIDPLGNNDLPDGLALYVLGPEAPKAALTRRGDMKPTVFATTENPESVIDAAREVAAIDEILNSTAELGDDWVARRELLERRVEAAAALDREFHVAYSNSETVWSTAKPPTKGMLRWQRREAMSASSVISNSCDQWYYLAPTIRNDLISRHDLSSQAAKARRLVVEGMISHASEERLGITGFGPENTLYLSVLAENLLHRQNEESKWEFGAPASTSSLLPTWDKINELIQSANSDRLRVSDLYEILAAPPYGVRAGVVPVIFCAALIAAAEEVALYEHGTLRPVLADDIIERLLKNPGNFEVKHYASRTGIRAEFLTELANVLGVRASRSARQGRVGSVLAVVSHLVALTNLLPEHTKKTHQLSADTVSVRRLLLLATEPDELLFSEIPETFGKDAVSVSASYDSADLLEIANRLGAVCSELRGAYPALLDEIYEALQRHVGPSCNPLREGLAARAREIEGKIIDPQLRKLTVALIADIPDRDSWLSYIAMNVSGVPPEGWTDEDRKRFFVSIAQIGATFRRIHALNADLDARDDGFDAYRSVMTRAGGSEIIKVIQLDDAMRNAGQPALEHALEQVIAELSITETEARNVLSGLLGEADFAASPSVQHLDDTDDDYGGSIKNLREGP
jgi:hypothetical protein